jgi:lipopolysaccharide export system permease protein
VFSILNRMIFLELVKVFTLSLLGLTGILLLAGILAEASREGLAPHQILVLIPLIIPGTLPYTVPATTLFATCVVYGRLAHDNEVLAIRSAGVNVLRVLRPAFLLGLAMSGTTFALYYEVIPSSYHLMKTLFLKDVESLLYAILQKDGYFRHPSVAYEIHVHKVQGKKLQDALFMHRDASGRFDMVARAVEAELLWDPTNNKILIRMRHCRILGDKSVAHLDHKVLDMDVPPDINPRSGRVSDMTWPELFEWRQQIVELTEQLDAKLAVQAAQKAFAKAPDDLPKVVNDLQAARRRRGQQLREVHVQMHMRPALALGCLCFVLVGCPVSIWFSRSDYLSAFVTCFLPIVVVYYPLILCGLNLSRAGNVPYVVGVWAANGLICVVALVLLRRLLRN